MPSQTRKKDAETEDGPALSCLEIAQRQGGLVLPLKKQADEFNYWATGIRLPP